MQKMTQKGGEYATDALAVALAAYVDAMQKYSRQRHVEWSGPYSDEESKEDFEELVTVADRLEAVLAVGGERLKIIPDAQKKMRRWAKALRNAETDSKQQAGKINSVRLVVWVGESIYDDLVELMETWCEKHHANFTLHMILERMEKSSDALYVALAKFFRDMERYKHRHEGDFMRAFDEDEKRLAEIGVANLDKS
jgi:hypothetical protein